MTGTRVVHRFLNSLHIEMRQLPRTHARSSRKACAARLSGIHNHRPMMGSAISPIVTAFGYGPRTAIRIDDDALHRQPGRMASG
jgi:hypothetical protein